MSACHFGLNIMKASVCVGLTMKSIDYFRHGLPIINSIPADTQELVEREKIGIQLNEHCVETIASLSAQDCLQMRENVKQVFGTRFARDVILGAYRKIYASLI